MAHLAGVATLTMATLVASAAVASPDDSASSGSSSAPPASSPESTGAGDTAVTTPALPAIDVTKTIPGVPPTVPGAVPDHASIDQIVAAAMSIVGPSTDMAGAFSPIVDVPAGIPTPAGSTIVDFNLWFEPDDDPDDSHYRASIGFTSTASASDIADFFATLLPAAGFPQTGNSTSSDEFGRSRVLDFDNPDVSYWMGRISVTVDEPADAEEEARHEIVWYADADMSILDPFLGWTAGLPLPDDAVPVEATFNTSAFFDIDSISVDITYQIASADPAESKVALESQLPAAGFAIDPDGAEDTDEQTSSLIGPGMKQINVYWGDGTPSGTRANFSARIVI